ncbi:hypothetical protein V490_00788 [Pseudogymnoascus sp. VKM F-3557]|nr:hypothetical protein V490_00788 [Pseudogymnoascus sp. VKM F-3557]
MPPPMPPSSSSSKQKAKAEPFSDASSSYWPTGWSWARYSDPDEDFSTLSEEEMEKMRNGLQEVLGDDGIGRMSVYLRQKRQEAEDQKLRDAGVPPPEYSAPDFLKQWRKRNPGPDDDGGAWGFIGFRTTLYDDEARWSEFKDRVNRILHVAFDRVVEQHRGHEYEDVTKARLSFEIRWIEDPELEGAFAETLRKRYTEVKKEESTRATGMDYNMFLCASPQSVDSVMSLDEDDFPTTKSPFWRTDAPFLLVVMEAAEVNPHGDEEDEYDPLDPHNERNWYKSVFKVPVEIIPDTLWDLMDRDFIAPSRLTRGVKGSEELGDKMPKIEMLGGGEEFWWGMGPSPRSMRRRRGV